MKKMFVNLWNKLWYTFDSDEAYYNRYAKANYTQPLAAPARTEVKAVMSLDNTVENVGRVRPLSTGKTALIDVNNKIVGTYSRRRDAVRAAQRRGIRINEAA